MKQDKKEQETLRLMNEEKLRIEEELRIKYELE
jgi:hypothetical protein